MQTNVMLSGIGRSGAGGLIPGEGADIGADCASDLSFESAMLLLRVQLVTVAVIALSISHLYYYRPTPTDASNTRLLSHLTISAIIPHLPLLVSRCVCLALIIAVILHQSLDPIGFMGTAQSTASPDRPFINIRYSGRIRFCTFTTWSWCLQGLFFLLAIALQLELTTSPLVIELTAILFEISLTVALLVTSVCTYVLIPGDIRAGNDPKGFFSVPVLMMHNANLIFMVIELCWNRVEFDLHHLPFVLLYGAAYTVFSWVISYRHGFTFYFFLNHYFPYPVTAHLALLSVLGTFFAIATAISHVFNPEQNVLAGPTLALCSYFLCSFRPPILAAIKHD